MLSRCSSQLLILVFALALTLVSASTASAARFSGAAIGSNSDGERVPKHHFIVGNAISLRLRDKVGQRTRFKVCLMRSGEQLRCWGGRTGKRGSRGFSSGFVFTVAPEEVRTFVYRWYVGGKEIAAWRVSIGVGD
jgi:hypothetical protein